MWKMTRPMFFMTLTSLALARASEQRSCPRECICENAPLRAAPFVLSWMTSWGEDDLPDLHPNEVFDSGMMASSGTALDAEVNVDEVGLHATCSLHQTTNITKLLLSLPVHTMMLSVLQAPGCNLTILDGGDLINLKGLRALHMQGYAHIKEKQVSGYSPNSIPEIIAHKKLLHEEIKKDDGEEMRDLRFALAEDALQPLENLKLLDLQYVRLVASRDARRNRRYSTEPLSSQTVLDMPLVQFLRFADGVDNFHLPPHLQHFIETTVEKDERQSTDDNTMDNQIRPTGDKYKIRRKLFTKPDEKTLAMSMKQKIEEKNNKKNLQFMELNEVNIVPFAIYQAEMQPQLAPFHNLKNLKYLRVAHARLDKVGFELLDGLQQLHTLTLEYNKIKILPSGIFAPTPNLRHLSLAHNSILLLEAESLVGLNQLLTLDLDSNQLSILGPATLPPLPSLRTLRVNDNPITHLLPDTFSSVNSTESIFLGSYGVSMDIHENSFRFLSSVNSLVLNNISMSSLQKTLLYGMPRVEHLTIHGNIPEIDYDAFSTTRYLLSLNFSHCQLNMLSLDAFFGLSKLAVLDLSFNNLTSISPGTFDHLITLKELYLHHNSLTTLPLGIFIPIPAKLIQLNHNPWHCTCDLLQLRPSVTNKVSRSSQVVCQWDEKLGTVCTKTGKRLVYDARVAPLCSEPSDLVDYDVYHAALRHLKCSKYHWDPRLILADKEEAEAKMELEVQEISEEDKDENLSKNSLKWLPLAAYTPEPIVSEDLLNIAEKEGLEEVLDEVTEAITLNTTDNLLNNSLVDLEIIKNSPQSDQPPELKTLMSQKFNPYTDQHREQKRKIKAMMKEIDQKRKVKKIKFLQMISQKNEEKSKIKELLSKKKKSLIKSTNQQSKKDLNSDNLHKLKSSYPY